MVTLKQIKTILRKNKMETRERNENEKENLMEFITKLKEVKK
jgi:hypothetical protein